MTPEERKGIEKIIELGRYYYLDGKTPRPVRTPEQWVDAFSNESVRQLAYHELLSGKIRISTIFLAIDHNWLGGPPVLFETMIFGGIYDMEQWRYDSYDQAKMGHWRAVTLAKHGLSWRERLKYFFTKKRKYDT